MFSSISQCTPNSLQTTSFTASSDLVLDTVSSIAIKVDGQLVLSRPVNISAGTVVSATISSPVSYLEHDFYHYSLNGTPQYFAVVNKNNYTPTVKSEYLSLRWYNLQPLAHDLSFKTPQRESNLLALPVVQNALIQDLYAVPDPIAKKVYFYSNFGLPYSYIDLPDGPIACQLIKKIVDNSVVDIYFLALANTGKLYRIDFDLTISAPRVFEIPISTWVFEDLSYDEDISFVGSFASVSRKKPNDPLNPNVTSFAFDGTHIWLAGSGRIWILNTNLSIVKKINFVEFVNGIHVANNQAFVTTRDNSAYCISIDGTQTLLYTGESLGSAAIFDNTFYIPDSNRSQLIAVDINNLAMSLVPLPGVAPAYLAADSSYLYIACHDNGTVYQYDSTGNLTYTTFKNKVTWVAPMAGNLLASHWLASYQILVGGLKKVLPISLTARTGPVGQIGTTPVKIKMLGDATLDIYSPPDTTVWVNGAPALAANDENLIGVSFSAGLGKHRRSVVIGEDAFDYDITVVDSVTKIRNVEFTISEITADYVSILVTPSNANDDSAAIEYGSIEVNSLPYYGNSTIKASDQIKIIIPMSQQQQPVAPIFTLGSRQFAVPVSTDPLQTQLVKIDNLEKNSAAPAQQFIITRAGNYVFPRYTTSAPVFLCNNIPVNSYTKTLEVGDSLTFSNLISSARIYDNRDFFVVGPENFHVTTQTVSLALIDPMDFGQLIEPLVKRQEIKVALNGLDIAYTTTDSYVSIERTVANASPAGTTIKVSDVLANIIVNGMPAGAEAIVYTGDIVKLLRSTRSYYEDSLTVYQVQTDDSDDTAEIPLGQWQLINIDTSPQASYGDQYMSIKNNCLHEERNVSVGSATAKKDQLTVTYKKQAAPQIIDEKIAAMVSFDFIVEQINQLRYKISAAPEKNYSRLASPLLFSKLRSIEKLVKKLTAFTDSKNYFSIKSFVSLQFNNYVAGKILPSLNRLLSDPMGRGNKWVHNSGDRRLLVAANRNTINQQHILLNFLGMQFLPATKEYTEKNNIGTGALHQGTMFGEMLTKELLTENVMLPQASNVDLQDQKNYSYILHKNLVLWDPVNLNSALASNHELLLEPSTVLGGKIWVSDQTNYSYILHKNLVLWDPVNLNSALASNHELLLESGTVLASATTGTPDFFNNTILRNGNVENATISESIFFNHATPQNNFYDLTILKEYAAGYNNLYDGSILANQNTSYNNYYGSILANQNTSHNNYYDGSIISNQNTSYNNYYDGSILAALADGTHNQFDNTFVRDKMTEKQTEKEQILKDQTLHQFSGHTNYCHNTWSVGRYFTLSDLRSAQSWGQLGRTMLVTSKPIFFSAVKQLPKLVAPKFGLVQPHVLVKTTGTFGANSPHLLIKVVKDFAAEKSNLRIPPQKIIPVHQADLILEITASAAQLEIEYTWTSLQLEKYGAYLSAIAAATDAVARGADEFVTLPLYQSEYFTFREIFEYKESCALPVARVYPIAWLVRGG